jgi:hypothetical protein
MHGSHRRVRANSSGQRSQSSSRVLGGTRFRFKFIMAKFAEFAKKSPSTFGASLGANKPCPKKKMAGYVKQL